MKLGNGEENVAKIEVDGRLVEVELWDILGTGYWDFIRPICYLGSHIILIAFSPDVSGSLESVEEKWIHEVKRYRPDVSIILLCCKRDLREDKAFVDRLNKARQKPTSFDEGLAAAQRIGAAHYLECSAHTGEGIHEVTQYTARLALLMPQARTHSRCVVL
jgi:Ras family protein A